MALLRYAPYLVLITVASAVTPIEKVITLLEDMKSQVEEDGIAEAKTYGEFTCFCKKTTADKADSVTKENENIDMETANIAQKTEEKKEDAAELVARKKEQETLAAELAESNALWAKELAEYTVEEADYSKAISSLKSAIKAMQESKPSAAAMLQMRKDLSQTLKLAEAMDLVPATKHKVIASFLQGEATADPVDPEYKYHSDEIIAIMVNMLKEFKEDYDTMVTEHEKAKKAAKAYQASLQEKMDANLEAMNSLEKSISTLEKEIAQHHEALLKAKNTLQDDEDYLNDLTKRCETGANDWDQRSSMRNDEITAISTALKVLKDEVQPADEDVNVRAMLLQKAQQRPSSTSHSKEATASKPTAASSSATLQSISLLQEGSAKSSLLRGAAALEEKRNRALVWITSEGQRLNSVVLTSLAAKTATDPFKKVKFLIQRLIERLLAEARNEATKKGFCDTELGKARKDRDFRFEEVNDLSSELGSLEAKERHLVIEIKELAKDIEMETKALAEAEEERKLEKEQNAKTVKTANEGHEAVTEALTILRDFYKQAAKAMFLQASPVDEDTDGPGFSGAYKGQQSGQKAVLDLLETIQSDFDRTIRTTEAEEENAARDHVKFVQTAKASIASKTTKKELDEEDLETTRTLIKTKTADLQTAMNLLDKALQEIEELKPQCIDTGMSYKERVQKREDEMEALKKALCILDGEGVEPECAGKVLK
jgi:hypothetical protein